MIMSQSEEVQTKVLNALYWDLAVPPHRVKVEVENGWVTISGTVDRYYQRTCAESDARRVAGVLGVNNHIRLASANAEQGATAHVAIAAAPPARLTSPNGGQTFRDRCGRQSNFHRSAHTIGATHCEIQAN